MAAGRVSAGVPEPLGVTLTAAGVNVAVASTTAWAIDFCLFDVDGRETRVRLPARTGEAFHGHVEGVAEGARTGLASVVTGLLFLLALFLAPFAGLVPPEATAPALIIVGFLMFAAIREIDVTNLLDGFPALLTLIMMPLTYSITNGIGAGFVSYVFLRLVSGRAREVPPLLWIVSLAFVIYFAVA